MGSLRESLTSSIKLPPPLWGRIGSASPSPSSPMNGRFSPKKGSLPNLVSTPHLTEVAGTYDVLSRGRTGPGSSAMKGDPTTHWADVDFSQCYQQIRRLPDVQGWVKANKRQVMNTRLSLRVGSTYYVAVRVTLLNGEQTIAFSNGVTVVERDSSVPGVRLGTERREASSSPSLEARQVMETSGSCSIDDDNRCRQAQISVADRLNELYGPPVFEDFRAPAGFVYADQSNDDDDDDDNADYAWVVAPVVGFVLLVLLCLCLLLLLAALLAKGGLPEREPRAAKPPKAAAAAPVAFVEQDEQKAYGMRDDVDVVDASTNTVVEFPDTQIRRLSISHKDEDLGEVAGGEPKRGRAPHPIMVSASSSFRDYRSGVNH